MPESNIIHGITEPAFVRDIKRHQVHEIIISMMNNKDTKALKLLKAHIESAIEKCADL